MIINKNQILDRNGKKPILIDTFYKNDGLQKPVVIFCHGYKGFKDWGCWDLVARAFARAGFFFVKFNFSHNGGTVGQPIDFPDLEAFGNNNYTKEMDDLGEVIDWTVSDSKAFHPEINKNNIALIGHSRGGGIATLKANEDTRIKSVVSWAGVSDYKNRFPKGEAFAKWQKDGVYYVINGRTKQEMPHFFQYYEDFIANKSRLTIKIAAQNLDIPHLIVHGTTDESVKFSEAKALHKWNSNSKLIPIENANHVFGGKHPWDESEMPIHLEKVVTESIEFLTENINQSPSS